MEEEVYQLAKKKEKEKFDLEKENWDFCREGLHKRASPPVLRPKLFATPAHRREATGTAWITALSQQP